MVNLNINIDPLPVDVEREIVKKVMIKGMYGEMDSGMKDKIVTHIKNRYRITITTAVVDSIRSAYTKDKIIFRHNKLKRLANKLYGSFQKGSSIVDLSMRYDFPPMSIVRQFLLLKNNKKMVKDLLRNPDKINDKKLRDEVKRIDENNLDIYVRIDQSNTHELSEQFEIKLGEFLTKHNIRFRTQEELSEEQIKKHGKAINTPDFLLMDDVKLNGHSIRWIDAKNFFGSNSWHTKESIKRQTRKYIDRWGKGAIIFSLGYSAQLKINDNVYISALPSTSSSTTSSSSS